MNLSKSAVFLALFMILPGCRQRPDFKFKSGITVIPPGRVSEWTYDSFASAYEEAALGFSHAIQRVNWHEVEVRPGHYNFTNYDTLCRLAGDSGMRLCLIVEVIHTVDIAELPKDMQFTTFKDPALEESYFKLCSNLITRQQQEIDHFWIGNEVDHYLFKNPKHKKPFISFCSSIMIRLRKLFPEISYGVIGAYHMARQNGQVELLKDLAEEADEVALTCYVQEHPFNSGRSAAAVMNEMVRDFKGEKIAIVESSFSTTAKQGSPGRQLGYCRDVIRTMDKLGEYFSIYSMFVLYDLADEVNAMVAGSFGIGAKADWEKEFLDWQGSLGLIGKDGKPNPAWGLWKANIVR